MMKYRILLQSGAVYVKEEAFFCEQGGLTEPWGQRWIAVQADSIEHARLLGKYQNAIHALSLLRSVIFSGENWSEECQNAYISAL